MFCRDELHHDALVEILNLGAGRAAAAMSRVVGEEVRMSFPSIAFMTRAEAAYALGGGQAQRLCAVSQYYHGALNATAMLLFLEEKSMEIVGLMVGQLTTSVALTEMEQEAMCEIGNIVLNCCMGSLADATGREMHGSLPVYRLGSSEQILAAAGEPGATTVLTMTIDFNVEKHHIHGYLALLLDVATLDDLPAMIDRYLAVLPC